MLLGSDARLISGIRSSHSRPSAWSWPPCAAPAGDCASGAGGVSKGTSFMPHLGQVPGSVAVTSGCIGHAYEVGVGAARAQLHAAPGSSRLGGRDIGCIGHA